VDWQVWVESETLAQTISPQTRSCIYLLSCVDHNKPNLLENSLTLFPTSYFFVAPPFGKSTQALIESLNPRGQVSIFKTLEMRSTQISAAGTSLPCPDLPSPLFGLAPVCQGISLPGGPVCPVQPFHYKFACC
jgi:hypothetical protein